MMVDSVFPSSAIAENDGFTLAIKSGLPRSPLNPIMNSIKLGVKGG
jgi:hypothetical protein